MYFLYKDYVLRISSVFRSILGMPMFREPCSPLHQGEEQPDTVSNVDIPKMDLNMEEIRK